ncbi:hypothetical protein CBG25_06490 [Arsenophonus sp. ENCA]|uniref:hypothetical protein n=1 Tax=Arsenophonus sp. ENCA TaxID=1987579 RepID=UPI000BC4CF96|nr:hypothetical protein [Arsenophonus sp. ENCA]PAV05379.1 hypothetical protein CBG25_06490 [Arsenophonus sp. ENCA]
MKFISFRIKNDNYNKLKDAIIKLSGKTPAAFFSALANKIIYQHTTDVDTISSKEAPLSNVRQIRLSNEMLNQLTQQADSRHWSVAKEIRFMLNLAMTTEPVLLDEEVEELRRARNAVNTAGRNLATIIRQRQYHDVKETELWEAVKKINNDVGDVKKAVRQLTNAAVNVRSVKIRNTPK